MLRITRLIECIFARLRRPLAGLMILPCLSIPDFAVDEFHVEGKALRSWIWDLHSSDWSKQIKACGVLGSQGERSRAAVPALIAVLHDKDAILRHCAIDALGEIGTPPDILVCALLPCLEDKVLLVRSSAQDTLLKLLLKWERTVDASDLTPILLRLFTAPYAALRMEAVCALGEIDSGPSIAVPTFVKGLQDEDPLVRGNCLIMLSKRAEDARANLPAIRSMMRWDPSESVRIQAAIAVWRLDKDAKNTVPVFLAEIEKNAFTNQLALLGLAEMGPAARSAAPALRAWLSREQNRSLRSEIEQTLASIDKRQVKSSSKSE